MSELRTGAASAWVNVLLHSKRESFRCYCAQQFCDGDEHWRWTNNRNKYSLTSSELSRVCMFFFQLSKNMRPCRSVWHDDKVSDSFTLPLHHRPMSHDKLWEFLCCFISSRWRMVRVYNQCWEGFQRNWKLFDHLHKSHLTPTRTNTEDSWWWYWLEDKTHHRAERSQTEIWALFGWVPFKTSSIGKVFGLFF